MEGSYIEVEDGGIFSIKGMIHPPDAYISFPKYLPGAGDREKGGMRYRRIGSMEEGAKVLEERYPGYLKYDKVFNTRLCEVPRRDVVRLYDPREGLKRLMGSGDPSIRDAIDLACLLSERSGIGLDSFGVSGSMLLGLHKEGSDIDLVIYGYERCLKVREALRGLIGKVLDPYTVSDLARLYGERIRDTPMDFDRFVWHEARKLQQGVFMGREYFIRFVKERYEIDERYGSKIYTPIGMAEVRAIIDDDSESFLTPCRYLIKGLEVIRGANVNIREIVSFRGRFCEQAFKGERVAAKGRVELVKGEGEYYRLLLGYKGDYMVVI